MRFVRTLLRAMISLPVFRLVRVRNFLMVTANLSCRMMTRLRWGVTNLTPGTPSKRRLARCVAWIVSHCAASSSVKSVKFRSLSR